MKLTDPVWAVSGLTGEAARLSRATDFIAAILFLLVLTVATHVHVMLTIGDWDFWVDWKDRRYWITLTPILMIMFPAAAHYIFWKLVRLPLGATLAMGGLMLSEWLARYFGFHMWSYFPMSMVWPATLLPSALVLDAVLLLTGGSMFLTAVIGGASFALLFPAANWTMLAAYHLPIQHQGDLLSLADFMGFTFNRTSTPEYLRIIERGTLRTFGGESTSISAFFSAFVCILMYMVWWIFGKMMMTTAYVANPLKKMMGLSDVAPKIA